MPVTAGVYERVEQLSNLPAFSSLVVLWRYKGGKRTKNESSEHRRDCLSVFCIGRSTGVSKVLQLACSVTLYYIGSLDHEPNFIKTTNTQTPTDMSFCTAPL